MATSLLDDHDAELNRLRVVIDNDASDRATVIRVENLSSKLGNFAMTISRLGTTHIFDHRHYPPSRCWDGGFSVTDDCGNKIAGERTNTNIQTAIKEMERQHLTCMNAQRLDYLWASLCRNIKDAWDGFDLDEAIVKRKLRADLENLTSNCYFIDLDVSKAELLVLHRSILAECAGPDKRPIFHARFLGYFHSQEDKPPAVGSSPTENGNPGASLASNSRLDERSLPKSSHFSEERHGLKVYALVMPRSSMSRDVGAVAPCLWLDSGASSHMVGDSRILINLRDLPTGRVIITADGSRLAVAKVGDIQTPEIRIQDVFYVPGLQMNLVSVRQLAKSKVVTTFYENHAKLCLEGEQIGGAIVDDAVSLYKLRYLH